MYKIIGKQVKPITKKIDFKRLSFVFELKKRWRYHLDDFSIPEFKNILKEININLPLKISKEKNGIFLPSNSYFLFFDEIKKKSSNPKFLDNFYKYFLKFISSEYKKIKTTPKKLIYLVSAIKKLNFKMSLLDFIHNLLIKNLKDFLTKKYHFKENKNLEYFIPPLSFTTYKFLLTFKENKNFYDKKILKHIEKYLNKHHIKMLIKNVEINQRKINKSFNKLEEKQKNYFNAFKKLVWLRDIVDYYYDEITIVYGNILSSIFKRERIKYSSKNFLEICQFSMAEIQEIRKNKFYSHSYFPTSEKRKNSHQKNYVFPLKGTVASKGNFRGTVKIIRNMSDIKKITPKDILISQYTYPSLVVGMSICKGIITEDGGLTSHAAIVSRELGKPCLIGVEGCIDALKDGDKIKVIDGKIYKVK